MHSQRQIDFLPVLILDTGREHVVHAHELSGEFVFPRRDPYNHPKLYKEKATNKIRENEDKLARTCAKRLFGIRKHQIPRKKLICQSLP